MLSQRTHEPVVKTLKDENEQAVDDLAKRSVEELFKNHNDLLLRFLTMRLGNEADARDAAQEAYVRLLQLDQPDRPSFMRAYLFKTAANVATDVLRRRRTRNDHAAQTASDDAEPPSQEAALAARQQLRIIDEALKELPPRCRAAFLLSRREGWNAAQIADHLGVSDRMVRAYLVRALEHIQGVLAEQTAGEDDR
jgi:RNA polymerase sigma-70 factor (ECF subfamily)